MPKAAEKGVEELDPTNAEGNGSDGAADQGAKERLVPLSVLEATRTDLKGQLARALREIDGLKAGPAKPATAATRDYTRAELRAMVNEGKITEDTMDATLEDQAERRVTAKAEALVNDRVTGAKSEATIEAEIDRYVEAYPDLNEDSDTREKVAAQFKKLVARGFPNSLATELTAMETALGVLGGAPKGRKKALESHEETGGAGGGRNSAVDDDGIFKGVKPKIKAHYQKQIDRGMFKGAAGQKALKAELDMARGRPN